MQKLSEEYIQSLFKFVRSKYVPYIDLQCEIVDHLASDIEALQNEDKTLSFDAALSKVYAKFPITGFSNLKAAKEKEMYNYWMRRTFKYYLSYFKLPKIILTLLMFLALYFTFQTTGLIGAYIFFGAIVILKFYLDYKHIKKFSQIDTQNYLVINSYLSASNIFSGMSIYTSMLVTHFDTLSLFADLNTTQLIVLSLLGSIFSISIPAIIYELPKMLKQELSEKYAHLNIEFA